DAQCTVNIQHNCHDNKCTIELGAVAMQEREKSSDRKFIVKHLNPSDFILNTSQMRDASTLQQFQV
ncbi:hypothetical protein M422DRAFT_136230, partial [Sphaerobolus stellatus SS14]